PRRGPPRARAALRRRVAGARVLVLRDLLAPPLAEPCTADHRPGNRVVRLRDGRPGGDLVPGTRRAAAIRGLGRDGGQRGAGDPRRAPAAVAVRPKPPRD